MAAFGSVASATASSATSVVITKPSSLAAGDLMVAFITEGNSGGTPNTPSGWTLITDINDIGVGGVDTFCFAKIADAGDAAASNFTFSYSGSNTNIEGILYRITGTFASTNNIYLIAADAAGDEPSSDVFRFTPGFTQNVASSVLLFHAHGVFSGTNTAPVVSAFALETNNPTWTEDVDGNSADTTRSFASAHATRTETTATGYYQVTYSVAVSNAGGILLAIADTQSGTATPEVISLTSSVITPTSTGGANVTASVISLTSSMPTATGSTSDPTIINTDKPSPGSISNVDKP